MSSQEWKFVPKPSGLAGPAAERQSRFLGWIQTYEGLEDPIGLDGLGQLRAFIDAQSSYVAEGENEEQFEATVGRLPPVRFAGFWLALDLVSVNGQKWGEVKYFHYVNYWFAPSPKRAPTGELPSYVIKSFEEMARVPIDAFLQAYATLFTVKAQEAQRKGAGEDIFIQSWIHQAALLRTAHAFETALLVLHAKSQVAAV